MTARAEEFVAKLQDDTQLQTQLASAATPEDRKKIVTDAGYGDVSSSDAQAVIDSRGQSGELSEDELGAASGAGGFGITRPGGWGIGGSW